MQLQKIAILCSDKERTRERRGLLGALERIGYRIVYIEIFEKEVLSNYDIRSNYLMAIYPDPPRTRIPSYVQSLPIPTIILHIDSFSASRRRALYSRLFDVTVLYHPLSQTPEFKESSAVHVLPHAIHHADYADATDQQFDIGWVGSLEGRTYANRRVILDNLKGRFSMVGYGQFFSDEEVPAVYKSSRVVVNIPRDDHPADANTRCFEAMAAGALLITPVPSELSELGFTIDVHFVGYDSVEEITGIVRRYLDNESERQTICTAARNKVLASHTYDARVKSLLAIADGLKKSTHSKFSATNSQLILAHHYVKYGSVHDCLIALSKVSIVGLLMSPILFLEILVTILVYRFRTRKA